MSTKADEMPFVIQQPKVKVCSMLNKCIRHAHHLPIGLLIAFLARRVLASCVSALFSAFLLLAFLTISWHTPSAPLSTTLAATQTPIPHTDIDESTKQILLKNSGGLFTVDEILRSPELRTNLEGGILLALSDENKTDHTVAEKLRLMRWPQGYYEFDITVKNGHTEEYMQAITDSDKPIVFLLPPLLLTYSAPAGTTSFTVEEFKFLLAHPERMKNVYFVYGAYAAPIADSFFAPQRISNLTSVLASTTEIGFYQTLQASYGLPEGELVRQNNNFGEYQAIKVTPQQVIFIGDRHNINGHAALYLDKNGTVYQHLEYYDKNFHFLMPEEKRITTEANKRSIFIPLSHGVVFKQIFLRSDGQLFGIDQIGQVHIFRWDYWHNKKYSKDFQLAKRLLASIAAGINLFFAGVIGLEYFQTGRFAIEWAMTAPVVNIAFIGNHLALVARQFEMHNESPNGFLPTGITVGGPVQSFEINEGSLFMGPSKESLVKDYFLTTRKGRSSLAEQIARVDTDYFPPEPSVKSFGVCERHLTLPKGMPSQAWEK